MNVVQPSVLASQMDVNRVVSAEDTVDDREVLSLVQTAIRRADLKQDYLAHRAHIAPSQLSGALNGHGALNARWLWHWPAEFWSEFLVLLCAHKDSSEAARREQRKQRLVQLIENLLSISEP